MVDASAAPASPKLRKQSSSKSLRSSSSSASSKRALHCNYCGVRTHRGSKLFKVELKNEDVHNGVCIRCNLPDMPPVVRDSWIKQNSSHVIAPVDDKDPVKPKVKSTKVVEEQPVDEPIGDESPTDISSDDSTESPSQSPDTSLLYDESDASLDTLEFKNPSTRDFGAILLDNFEEMLIDAAPKYDFEQGEELLNMGGKTEEELYDEAELTMVYPVVEHQSAVDDVAPKASLEEEPIEEELVEEEPIEEEPIEEEPIMMFLELEESPAADIFPEVNPEEDPVEEIFPSDPVEPVVAETLALPATETSGGVMLADPASSKRHRRTMMLAGAAVAVTGVAVAMNLNNKKVSSKAK